MSPIINPTHSAILFAQCEFVQSYLPNRSFSPSTQLDILELLAKRNLTFHKTKTREECVAQLEYLFDQMNTTNNSYKKSSLTFGIDEHSRSLLLFVYLIAFVSFISIIGNLCLAKVLYTKRLRLSQTDRIVLCLAISTRRIYDFPDSIFTD
ncbi:unnamed protein product [Adineta ricciae]|uniref:Uncharacterized protein n=1 Tax=Adineta ricciae TaxID=249248 RepID=A0A813Q7S7_ADIRI|nr:unnamed protein product [Adineta ricciae]CAF1150660.1 unnamed protein product [Adineta ricciae]